MKLKSKAREVEILEQLYLGTYTQNTGSQGLYQLNLEQSANPLQPALPGKLTLAAQAENPSWLTFSASGRCAYAVSEKEEGEVISFAVQPDGTFFPTANLPTHGKDPCHLCLCEQERLLFAANYTSGSLAVFTLDESGALSGCSGFVQHSGHGPNALRQEGPHLHFSAVEPRAKNLWTVDLGLDELTVYPLVPSPQKSLARLRLPAGFGPRHLVFHPVLPLAYVVSELQSAVAVVSIKDGLPQLPVVQVVSTLPAGFTGESWAAAIRLQGKESRLYVSNRGHDSIATFKVEKDGRLTLLGHAFTGGSYPRDILMVASGTALLCAHQKGGGVTRLALDKNGLPGLSQPILSPDSPVCLALRPKTGQLF